jgi:hypothetical protein
MRFGNGLQMKLRMALKSDDSDIIKSWLTVQLGGNGDYYVTVIQERDDIKESATVRISTSGGNAPSDVKCAVADLFRAMNKNSLNEFPE